MSGPGQTPFDQARLEALVQAVADTLEGEWLLIGGALVALWLEPGRTTLDIDLVGLRGESAERYALLDFAVKQSLPVEAINSAADFFVQRIPGWRDHLVLFRAGTRGRIFRPDATLFLLLKAGRLSERDLADCEALLRKERPDGATVLAALDALRAPADEAALARRSRLRELLDGSR